MINFDELPLSKAQQRRKRKPKKIVGGKNSKEKRKYWKRKCLQIWSEIIKKRAGNKCEMCGRSHGKLDAHHIIPRKTAIKPHWFDYKNGICLCFTCHRGLAHGLDFESQVAFHNWVVEWLMAKGEDYATMKIIYDAPGKMTWTDLEILYNQMVSEG